MDEVEVEVAAVVDLVVMDVEGDEGECIVGLVAVAEAEEQNPAGSVGAWILGGLGREIDCVAGKRGTAEFRAAVFRKWACLVLDLLLEGLFQ